jgi:hypothetical protein
LWTVLRLVLTDPSLTLRAIAFAPPHQMLVVGAVISLICLPVAIAVSKATPEELALPGFNARLHAEPGEGLPKGDPEHPGHRSYQGYN